jgi:serpin B
LWAGQGRVFLRQEFLDVTAEYYSSALAILDFGKPIVAMDSINNWASRKTNKTINRLIEKDFIFSDLVLVLTNAVYFKSDWKQPFQTRRTVAGEFRNESNSKVDVSYMATEGRFWSYKNEYVNILELPFVGDEFSFMMLLPINNMKEVEENLSYDDFDSWTRSLVQDNFTLVKIPKFKSSFDKELSDALVSMGMTRAFSSSAEFEDIGEATGTITLSKVVHQTFIEVNEEGAEASAATAVGAVVRSMPMPNEFIADHPFIYIIRHIKSNAIIFIGKISNPKY